MRKTTAKKQSYLYSGNYAAMILNYNDKVCQNLEERRRNNQYKKEKALLDIQGRKIAK